MITVDFAEAEAQAVANAAPAYIDDDYYPAIDLDALKAAYQRLTRAISNRASRRRQLRSVTLVTFGPAEPRHEAAR